MYIRVNPLWVGFGAKSYSKRSKQLIGRMSHPKNPKVCLSENMTFTVLSEKANKSVRQKKSFFRNFWEKLPNGWKWLPGKGLSSAACDWPWHSLTLEKESSNKLRQIQEISLLKILYPSLETGIPNQLTDHVWMFQVRSRVTDVDSPSMDPG